MGGPVPESAGTWGRSQPFVLSWKAGCCWRTHGVGVARKDETGTGGQVTAGTLPDFILELCGASHSLCLPVLSEGPVLGCCPSSPRGPCWAAGSLAAGQRFLIILEPGASCCPFLCLSRAPAGIQEPKPSQGPAWEPRLCPQSHPGVWEERWHGRRAGTCPLRRAGLMIC